jgi:hypothetical protein
MTYKFLKMAFAGVVLTLNGLASAIALLYEDLESGLSRWVSVHASFGRFTGIALVLPTRSRLL